MVDESRVQRRKRPLSFEPCSRWVVPVDSGEISRLLFRTSHQGRTAQTRDQGRFTPDTIANCISDLRLDFGCLRPAGLGSQSHPEVPQEHEDDPIRSIGKAKFQSLLPPPRKPIIPSLTLVYLRKSCVCTDLENIYFPLDDEAMTQ